MGDDRHSWKLYTAHAVSSPEQPLAVTSQGSWTDGRSTPFRFPGRAGSWQRRDGDVGKI